QRVPFVMTWHPSQVRESDHLDAEKALSRTERFWENWVDQCTYNGPHRKAVIRSLITLKALTYRPTGGIVAAPTTSLPEEIGGVRNWDYRYCWLRDATITLEALIRSGYKDEAMAWREWLVRAVAGEPQLMQIMYGIRGERRLTEWEADWLPGYENSRPVRIGNAAVGQYQLDVYGEVMDVLHLGRRFDISGSDYLWALQRSLVNYLEWCWNEPDEGLWEVRGPRQHFVHSKVMAWVAADRAVRSIEEFGKEGPIERWSALRDTIHAEVCEYGYDPDRNTFTQYYGSKELDAALLLIPRSAFCPTTIPASSEPSRRTVWTSWWTGSCCATAPTWIPPPTGSRARRVLSWRAASGWPTRCCPSAGRKRPMNCSSVCCPCATTSGCSPRN